MNLPLSFNIQLILFWVGVCFLVLWIGGMIFDSRRFGNLFQSGGDWWGLFERDAHTDNAEVGFEFNLFTIFLTGIAILGLLLFLMHPDVLGRMIK